MAKSQEEQEGLTEEAFADLIEEDYDFTRVQRGEIYEAVVLSIDENEVFVDLGVKRDGVIPSTDLEMVEEEYRTGLQVGESVPVAVLKPWGRRDEIVVSLNQGLKRHDWIRAEELLKSGEIVEVGVKEANRGGVVVPFGRLRGFVPNSHLTSVPRGLRGDRLQEAKEKLVGETLCLKVIEAESRRRRLVLSERAADRFKRRQLLEEIEEGEVRKGIVRNLVDFGAFVDLGGFDGLIHISELDWRHVAHPSEVLNVGDEVEVEVISVDRERERIGLSRKRLLPDPWHAVTDSLQQGQTVDGVVASVVDFGAFVDLGQGVEGLVHTSEMPRPDFGATLEPGSPVTVEVLNVDQARRRIALSLRRTTGVAPVSAMASLSQDDLDSIVE